MITNIHSTLFTQQISSDSLYQQLTKAFSLTWSHLILMRLFIHMKKQRLSSLPRVSKPRNNEARTKPWSSGCQGSPSAKPEKVSCQARPRDNIPLSLKGKSGLGQGPRTAWRGIVSAPPCSPEKTTWALSFGIIHRERGLTSLCPVAYPSRGSWWLAAFMYLFLSTSSRRLIYFNAI